MNTNTNIIHAYQTRKLCCGISSKRKKEKQKVMLDLKSFDYIHMATYELGI